jgi:hypothetical protein
MANFKQLTLTLTLVTMVALVEAIDLAQPHPLQVNFHLWTV